MRDGRTKPPRSPPTSRGCAAPSSRSPLTTARAPKTQGDIALAASEAITSAVIHAHVDTAPGTVSLEAAVAGDVLRVTVSDGGRGMRPRRDSPGLGRGVPTIAHAVASVSFHFGPDGRGTAVALEFTPP